MTTSFGAGDGGGASPLNLAFAESQQKVSEDLIKKRCVAANAYWGKIPDGGAWPLGSGTTILGYKLGRIGVPNCTGWKRVEDSLCGTNMCDFDPDVISNGQDKFYFSLVQKHLRTDWICVDSAAVREMGAKEIMHLEEGMQDITRYVHEEFGRTRYNFFCQNKILAEVATPGDGFTTDCANDYRNDAYVFEVRDDGEINECYIRVRVDPANIGNISELTMDMLDIASRYLAYEDKMYLPGTKLLDVLMADQQMFPRLAAQENTLMGGSPVNGGSGYNLVDLQQAYGTEGVLRRFALRSDIHAMRFWPDTDFNAGLAAYDADNPNTWPRMKREFAYIPIKAENSGIKYVINDNYIKAPFGISTILHPRVMETMSFPDVSAVGGASKAESFGYAGAAHWVNPEWESNILRKKGFWLMEFRMAAKPMHDEEGWSFFHRIDRRLGLQGNDCTIPTPDCHEDYTPYCYQGATGADDPTSGANNVIGGGLGSS